MNNLLVITKYSMDIKGSGFHVLQKIDVFSVPPCLCGEKGLGLYV